MHEAAIVSGAMQVIESKATENNLAKVCKIHFRIGELSGVSIDAMSFAFESASIGTIMEGAQLIYNIVEAKAFCNNCNKEYKVDRFNKFCPHCGEYSPNLLSGNELFVDMIDGE